jgi:hypothetical protein
MRAQASSTRGAAGVRVQAGSKIRRLISTWATERSKTVKSSKTSRATCESREVENTVRQMMSAVRWLMASRGRETSSGRRRALQLFDVIVDRRLHGREGMADAHMRERRIDHGALAPPFVAVGNKDRFADQRLQGISP